jgi:hypothetical protein
MHFNRNYVQRRADLRNDHKDFFFSEINFESEKTEGHGPWLRYRHTAKLQNFSFVMRAAP